MNRPTPEALDAARRSLVADMESHVRALINESLSRRPPDNAHDMAVLIFETKDPFVRELVSKYVKVPPPSPGQPNFGAAVVRRRVIPKLATATTPKGQPVFDCTPILAAANIPVACLAFGGMIVTQTMPRAGSA
jgi:hypothetical protein